MPRSLEKLLSAAIFGAAAALLATGIASFGHVSGIHYQNVPEWKDYVGTLEQNQLPLGRALQLTQHQKLIREMILQLKRGYLDADRFRSRFQVDILEEWNEQWQAHAEEGMLEIEGDRIALTRKGLLHADGLLPPFFEPEHRGVRYT